MSVHLKKLPVQINVVTVIGFIILIAFYTKGYSQEEDTSMVVADSISFSEDDDSVSTEGLEMINDPETAQQIVDESTPVMMLDSLTSIPALTF